MARSSTTSAAVTGNNIPATHYNNLAHDVAEIYPALPASNTQTWVRDEFTTSSTWTCPTGVYTAYITACGGGGGGSGGNGSTTVHQGGGGGAFVHNFPLAVTPGTVYTVTIGAAGSGGSTSAAGTAGGATSITASGKPGIHLDGGSGGALSSSSDGNQQAIGDTNLRNWNWPEIGCMRRIGQGRVGANGPGLGSDVATGGRCKANAANQTTPGYGGGGGSGHGSGGTDACGGSASLGRGGDVPTSSATTTGLAGGGGYVAIDYTTN